MGASLKETQLAGAVLHSQLRRKDSVLPMNFVRTHTNRHRPTSSAPPKTSEPSLTAAGPFSRRDAPVDAGGATVVGRLFRMILLNPAAALDTFLEFLRRDLPAPPRRDRSIRAHGCGDGRRRVNRISICGLNRSSIRRNADRHAGVRPGLSRRRLLTTGALTTDGARGSEHGHGSDLACDPGPPIEPALQDMKDRCFVHAGYVGTLRRLARAEIFVHLRAHHGSTCWQKLRYSTSEPVLSSSSLVHQLRSLQPRIIPSHAQPRSLSELFPSRPCD